MYKLTCDCMIAGPGCPHLNAASATSHSNGAFLSAGLSSSARSSRSRGSSVKRPPEPGACTINRPCAQQYVGKSQSCMVISGRLLVHAPVPSDCLDIEAVVQRHDLSAPLFLLEISPAAVLPKRLCRRVRRVDLSVYCGLTTMY